MSYKNVYLIGSGSFFPGEAVNNDDIDKFIKPLNSRSDKMKKMILKDNGIESRYYGINEAGETVYSLSQMGAKSVMTSLEDAGVDVDDLDLLTVGTCGGDAIVPGFANTLQAELKAKPMETSSHVGICASGIAALRHAADSIELGRNKLASVTACEYPSRMFKHTRFVEGYDVDFDSHFLRYMLSDGSGSFVLSNRPHKNRPSLKLLDITLTSYSGDHANCMYIGHPLKDHTKSMYDYPSFADAEKDGAMLLRQNIRMLPQLFEVCLHEYANLVNRGVFKPSEIDHFATHYSSKKFEGVMEELLTKLDIMVPKERWFSNLTYRGNMGAASIFTMIDDLLKEREVKPGEKILAFIPESGRFSCGFALFEVVDSNSADEDDTIPESNSVDINELTKNAFAPVDLELTQTDKLKNLVLNLSDVWNDYRSRIWRTEYFSKITKNELQQEDYLKWMENWIPQVREGSKWMRTAVSNMQHPYEELKEIIETHAGEEQDDWQILFQDYKNAGGQANSANDLTLNKGGKALNDFMYSRANSVNALDLLGGIYIIEGTGQRIIPTMLPLVRSQLSLPANCFKFLKYHGLNDEHHIQRWVMAVEIVLAQDPSGAMAKKIIETAKQVSNFYCEQMENIFKS